MFIFFIILILVLGFLFNAYIFKLIGKGFKVKNNTYGNALMILFLQWFSTVLVGVVIGLFLKNSIGTMIAVILGFLVFNWLCRKYYLSNFRQNILMFVLLNLAIIVLSLIVIIPIRAFIAEPFYSKGVSMEPTFKDHTYMIIKKVNNVYIRGDIVVFKYPNDQKQDFIKRIIGLPGEKIEVKDGFVYIYNTENPNGFKYDGLNNVSGDGQITMGANEYYVLGDNPGTSNDSRLFGAVNKDLIVGKYWFAPKLY